jgi:hypothetical protein
MPRLSRWLIKTAFIYLGIGLAIGILLAGQPIWKLPAFVSDLYSGYIHLLTVGWLTLLIFGVAYWMFPKYTLEQPHGNEVVSWAAYLMINIGLILRIIIEPFIGQYLRTGWAYVLVVSAFLQWVGGITFIIYLWKRVKVR